MQLNLDTSFLRDDQRGDAVQAFLNDTVVRCRVDHPSEMVSRLSYTRMGLIGICRVEATAPPDAAPAVFERTERQADDDRQPAVLVDVQVSGTSTVVQDGREAVLHPGEFALRDTTSRSVVIYRGGGVRTVVRVTRSALALPQRAQRAATARAFGTGTAVSALAATYLTRLEAATELTAPAHAHRLAAAGVDLIRAAVGAELADDVLDRHERLDLLHRRIMAYLQANLTRPDLNAAKVAAAHHISVRYLYTVLEHAGISLGSWIQTRRLEGARADLSEPNASTRPVLAIAKQWGFTDATHFSRAFRRAYGVSPSEWRDGR
ncbi:helix-turn-helix domain-containing protein [Micromonospora sp. MS34]|uniref:helix-turn-helix domain-containing protein n=1 Tax=Micromonospora sp. MS34 TaxID=3385971 RepID=UPI00399FCE17